MAAALRPLATEIQLPKRVNDWTDKRFPVDVASKVLIDPATRAQEAKLMGNPTRTHLEDATGLSKAKRARTET